MCVCVNSIESVDINMRLLALSRYGKARYLTFLMIKVCG